MSTRGRRSGVSGEDRFHRFSIVPVARPTCSGLFDRTTGLEEALVGFMRQRGGLKCASEPFVSEFCARNDLQFVVYEFRQPLLRAFFMGFGATPPQSWGRIGVLGDPAAQRQLHLCAQV